MPPTDEEKDAAAEQDAAADTKNDQDSVRTEDTADEEFDKERALKTIRTQRESEAAAKKRADELAAKVKEYEDAAKSKEERDAEAKAQSDREAAEAKAEVLRLRAAIKFGLDEEDLDLLGTGDEEQIDARAKRLSDLRNKDDGDQEDEDVHRRPRERLRTGAASKTEPEKTDPKSLAADVPRGPF